MYPCRAWFPYPPSVEALQAEMAKWSDFSSKARRIASMLIVAEATIQEVRANALVCIRLGLLSPQVAAVRAFFEHRMKQACGS